MNNDEMDPDEGGAERTSNVTDYKRTCIDFIEDISGSYFEWIDYYSKNKQIDENEDKKRRTEISAIVEKTNTWLAKVPMTIKAVDVVMNDGIQKMAESTAGKPFQIGVFINKISEYTMAKPGIIDIHVKASGRDGRNVKLGSHAQDERFRIESTGKVFFDEENIPENEFKGFVNEKNIELVNAKISDAREKNINGVPFFEIGKDFISGAQSSIQLESVIKSNLN